MRDATEWRHAEDIANLPQVDELLQDFAEDPTGDNGTMIVREVIRAMQSQAQQPTPSGKPFQTLADLLPDGFMWGDNLTPDAVLHIALAANLKQSQAQKEPVGEVKVFEAQSGGTIYVIANWYSSPPADGTKLYVLPPAPEGGE